MEIKGENGLEKAFDRRSFMKNTGLATAAIAGAVTVGGKLGVLDSIPGINKTGLIAQAVKAGALTDVDILNFALNLEYLEAEFYTVVTTGKTIEQSGIAINGTGNQGPTTGGSMVNLTEYGGQKEFTGQLKAVAAEITFDEQQHVLLLRSALGSDAIAKPAINLNALDTGFQGYRHFIALARAFEDVGVSAYGGAAPLIMSKTYLATAARIALTEAYHAGNLRLMAAADDAPTFAVDSQDILPPPSGHQFFTVDSQALSIVRTPGEVLAIVYHNSTPGATSGGFFPDGVNGNITTVTS
ncbi:MAG: ferritin-like domain-containing protein [Candidatus Acidiferrales bacterium]